MAEGRPTATTSARGASKSGYDSCPVKTVAAGEIEEAVMGQLRAIFRSPEMIAQVFLAARELEAAELERLRSAKADLARELEDLGRRRGQLLVSAEASDVGTRACDLNDEMAAAGQRLQGVSAELLARQGHLVTEQRCGPFPREARPGAGRSCSLEQQRIVHRSSSASP